MKKEISSNYQEWKNDLGDSHFLWDDFVNDFYKEEWEKLDNSEKAICMSYEVQLQKEETPSMKLIKVINEIHEKYPDFHMGCLPKKKEKSKPVEFRTMDFSSYLPEVNK